MNQYAIITDASADPKTNKGIGAYLILPFEIMHSRGFEINDSGYASELQYIQLDNTSSTEAEIKTAIHAISKLVENAAAGEISITLFTDSQNITKLPGRRQRLEKTDYISKRSGKVLKNASLYREFYLLYDKYSLGIIKVEGHKPAGQRDHIEEIFSFVDRNVREKFRSMR